MNRRQFLSNSTVLAAAVSFPFSCVPRSKESPVNITDLSATALSSAIKNKQVSCVEVMDAYLKRINRYNPFYNAIVSRVPDDILLAQAKKADAALAKGEYWGWMHGMPHAVKDLAPLKGMIHTSGSPMFKNRIAEEDAPFVELIRNQGAIFIGKTNTPEFGLGSQCYNPVFGATGSAYNPELTSGGSSGGAASGLGTRMLPVADGGDMMGSLRNPGAFNNVIGFRPSTNIMNDESSGERFLWTTGPMGRNTTDAAQLLQTIAPDSDFTGLNPLDLTSKKIGWLGDLDGYLPMESGIIELCESSLKIVSDAGAEVDSITPNFMMSDLWLSWTTLRHATRDNMMEFYNDPSKKELLKPELIWEIEQNLKLSEADKQVGKAIREDWYAELDRLFGDYDFLALPTAQVFPFSKEIHWPKEINGREMDTYHRWMEVVIIGSLGGIPVINVPVGFDNQGRPMGMQIMGKFGDDRSVLEFGLAYEEVTDFLKQRPTLVEKV